MVYAKSIIDDNCLWHVTLIDLHCNHLVIIGDVTNAPMLTKVTVIHFTTCVLTNKISHRIYIYIYIGMIQAALQNIASYSRYVIW